jgi:predicted oxidoreductase
MTMTQLTRTGPTLSRVVPGMMRLNEWNLPAGELLNWIKAAMDMGLTTFDHADIYGGYTVEETFGAALAMEPSIRQKMQIVTKCGIMMVAPNRPNNHVKHYDTTRGHITASVENSLRSLHTDHIDLLLLHRPDPLMNPHEIAETFYELYRTDKVRYFGVSNFTPSQFDMLRSAMGEMPLVTNQIEFSVTHTAPLTDGTLDHAQQHGYTPMAWSPLGSIFRAETDQVTRLKRALHQVGEELNGATPDQVALAWLLKHPSGVVPVVGTGKLERLYNARGALELAMTRQQWFRILEASAGQAVP